MIVVAIQPEYFGPTIGRHLLSARQLESTILNYEASSV